MKVKISDLLELSRVIDILDNMQVTVSDAFEIYNFKKRMEDVFSFLNDIMSNNPSSDFNKICEETINFNLPSISFNDIIIKYKLELTQEQKVNLKRILFSKYHQNEIL